LAQTQTPTRDNPLVRVDLFQYPAVAGNPERPPWPGWEEAGDAGGNEAAVAHDAAESKRSVELEQRVAQETQRAFEAGRERGRAEGRAAEQEAQAASIEAGRERQARQTAELVENFVRERDRYLQKVEHEVVQLALAVAARILRREAQMDPLLLTGAVRVALGQLAGSTRVTLKVPPLELDLWEEAIATMPKLALKPVVVAGEGMRLGDCRMEAELGSVDLGIRAQLAEIERGFFDRVGAPTAGRKPEPVVHTASVEAPAETFEPQPKMQPETKQAADEERHSEQLAGVGP
jgi:flagellar assembly protein FliH